MGLSACELAVSLAGSEISSIIDAAEAAAAAAAAAAAITVLILSPACIGGLSTCASSSAYVYSVRVRQLER
jgi:hypothetical protein